MVVSSATGTVECVGLVVGSSATGTVEYKNINSVRFRSESGKCRDSK